LDSFSPEDGGSKILQNVSKYSPSTEHHMPEELTLQHCYDNLETCKGKKPDRECSNC